MSTFLFPSNIFARRARPTPNEIIADAVSANARKPMTLVVIESPYGAPTPQGVWDNAAYARRCMLDSIQRGEAPYASHLLYTQMLDDNNPHERQVGMEAGFAWGAAAGVVAVYTDRGISGGMQMGIDRALARGATVAFRSLGESA